MGSLHRKLIVETINQTLTEVSCSSFCEEKDDNQSGFCPDRCLTFCAEICPYSLNSLIPPPPPSIQSIPPIPSLDQPHKTHQISLFLIISLAVISSVILTLFCYALFSKLCSRNRNSQRRFEQESEGTHEEFLEENDETVVDHHIWYIKTLGLESSIINSIAICKYRRDEGIVEGTECSVCLNEFQEDEKLRILPKCNHAFHLPCIDTWLRSHTNCPMCRAPIVRHVVPAPVPEPSVENSVMQGDDRGGVESDGISEVRIGIEEVGESEAENEIQPIRRSVSLDSVSASKISLSIGSDLDENSNTQLGNSNTQTRNLNAQMGNLNTQMGQMNKSSITIVPRKVCGGGNQGLMRCMGSSSIGKCQQIGTMKRSFSCNGN